MAGHRRFLKGLRAAAFLSIAIVALGASDPPSSIPGGAIEAVNDILQLSPPLIGKQITIRGKFSLRGKIGPYVALDNHQVVYLVSKTSFTWGKPYSEMDGKFVTATGTLRFYEASPAPPEDPNRIVARAPDFFYFEVQTTELRLIGH